MNEILKQSVIKTIQDKIAKRKEFHPYRHSYHEGREVFWFKRPPDESGFDNTPTIIGLWRRPDGEFEIITELFSKTRAVKGISVDELLNIRETPPVKRKNQGPLKNWRITVVWPYPRPITDETFARLGGYQ